MTKIAADSPRILEAAKYCASQANGMTIHEVADAMCVSHDYARICVREARKQGLVVRYCIPNFGWKWMSQTSYENILDGTKEKRRRASRAKYRRDIETGYRSTNNRVLDPPDWPIAQRWIDAQSAAEMPAPTTSAVNSVFALAAV